MVRKREQFQQGSSSQSDFWAWMQKRHCIWLKRQAGEKKPWTDDPILLDYKFTNVFRELDTGTIWLHRMIDAWSNSFGYEKSELSDDTGKPLVAWTCVWYRCFNWWEHAAHFAEQKGIPDMPMLRSYIKEKAESGKRVFTNAHMQLGIAGEDKYKTYLRTCYQVWVRRNELAMICKHGSMEMAFNWLLEFEGIGPFIAYEIVCDLRFTPLLDNASDRYSWANVGGGARRGLQRLGMDPTLQSMVRLWGIAPIRLPSELKQHHPRLASAIPPFELREIEHSLCEFDKYERIRLEQGAPRMKYDGRA